MKQTIRPDWILETSWEVCNKVGGIYTVLSTRARTMSSVFGDRVLFIGPDVVDRSHHQYEFEEDTELLKDWREKAEKEGLKIKIGRWMVAGKPTAVLVDFSKYYVEKNEIYTRMWNEFGVDSLHAYGDYDEAVMFAYSVGKVTESFCRNVANKKEKVIFHANEWTTGAALLYVKKHIPEVATIFTTHATTVGRSIAFNAKPLYDYFSGYNGNQMAQELNVESKHSLERQAAHEADCFTTVSEATGKECLQLLERQPDIILPNGLDFALLPKGVELTAKRRKSRRYILDLTEKLTNKTQDKTTTIIAIGGRNEFRNKGIDMFLDAASKTEVPTTAMVYIPHIKSDICFEYRGQSTIIYIPFYLDGFDGQVGYTYYDLLSGSDLAIFPSYYEPWGYTPLEAMALHIPTITTSVAGYGQWLNSFKKRNDWNYVVERNDHNYNEAVEEISSLIEKLSSYNTKNKSLLRKHSYEIAKKADWENFYKFYIEAYDIAFKKLTKQNK